MTTLQWMWGDASVVGHKVSEMNPWRWSHRASVEATIRDLQMQQEELCRPVEVKVRACDGYGRPLKPEKRHFASVEAAVNNIKELLPSTRELLPPGQSGGSQTAAEENSLPAAIGGSATSSFETNEDNVGVAKVEVAKTEVAKAEVAKDPATGSFNGGSFSRCTTGSEAISYDSEGIGPPTRQTDPITVEAAQPITSEFASPPSTTLAGMLWKRSHWRKEWSLRFFMMQKDRIDYYLQPPAIVDEANSEPRRGHIPLAVACAHEETCHPFCISIGGELLSCQSAAEQQRWLETINTAVRVLQQSQSVKQVSASQQTMLMNAQLLLLPHDATTPTYMKWHQPSTMLLPSRNSIATLLFMGLGEKGSGSGGSGGTDSQTLCSGASAICRLSFEGARGIDNMFQVQPLTSSLGDANLRLCVHILSNQILTVWPEQQQCSICAGVCVIALGMVLAGAVCTALATLLLMTVALLARTWTDPPLRKRQVTFSLEELETHTPSPKTSISSPVPKWVGKWRLDKSCSELYEPILADLGVKWVLRKAADAANSILTIRVSEKDVFVHVKIWVSIEDQIPLDGSWTAKPVPKGSPMKGTCRVCLTKNTMTELEMLTEFPDGNGTLRDTLTMSEDGNSFTRVVVRGALSVSRVFRREPQG